MVTAVAPSSVRFRLLYDWETGAKNDEVRKLKTRIYPAFESELNGVSIFRLVDHELEHHYISAGQLWRACGLTLTEGLFLFELKASEYQVDFLQPCFPWCDVWVRLDTASHMVSLLGVETQLDPLLSIPDTIFSSDNCARNELVHNWRAASIPSALYSTRALLDASLDGIELLENTRKIRTQISRMKQPGMSLKDRLETGLVRWQIHAYEDFLEKKHTVAATDEEPREATNYGAIWDVWQGLLCDLQTVASGRDAKENRVMSDTMMVGNMPLKRKFLEQSPLLQQIYMAVMAEKLFLTTQTLSTQTAPTSNEHEPLPSRPPSSSRKPPPVASSPLIDESSLSRKDSLHRASVSTGQPTDLSNQVDPNMMLHDRMDLLEQELYRMRRKGKKHAEMNQMSIQDVQLRMLELESRYTRLEMRRRRQQALWVLVASLAILWALFFR